MSDSQTLRSVLREPEASRTLAVASVSASESLPAGREAESQVDRPRANSNSFVEGMARELARGSARLGADDSEVREAFSAPSRRRSREARPASRPSVRLAKKQVASKQKATSAEAKRKAVEPAAKAPSKNEGVESSDRSEAVTLIRTELRSKTRRRGPLSPKRLAHLKKINAENRKAGFRVSNVRDIDPKHRAIGQVVQGMSGYAARQWMKRSMPESAIEKLLDGLRQEGLIQGLYAREATEVIGKHIGTIAIAMMCASPSRRFGFRSQVIGLPIDLFAAALKKKPTKGDLRCHYKRGALANSKDGSFPFFRKYGLLYTEQPFTKDASTREVFRSGYAANRIYFPSMIWEGTVYDDGRHIQNKALLAWLDAPDPEEYKELPFEPHEVRPLAWNCCRGGDVSQLDIFSLAMCAAMTFSDRSPEDAPVTEEVLTADAPPRGPPAS